MESGDVVRRSRGLCHVSPSIALSPLLHFVLKFSIQKIKGGEKTSERAGRRKRRRRRRRERRRRRSAIMDFISNPLPISPPQKDKRHRVPKKTHIFNAGLENRQLLCNRLAPRVFHAHTGPTCPSRRATSRGDVRTSTRLVVNTGVNRRGKSGETVILSAVTIRGCVFAHIPDESDAACLANNAPHNARCVPNKRISAANRIYLQITLLWINLPTRKNPLLRPGRHVCVRLQGRKAPLRTDNLCMFS